MIKKYRQSVLLFLIITLPIFIWAILKINFNYKEGAQEPSRASIQVGNSPFLGPITAPITIIEFADYECPHCKEFHDQTLQNLLESYPNQIKFVYKQFPIESLHPMAPKASMVALCANEQNKFWQMSDLLFQNQGNISAETIIGLATNLSLDLDLFNNCINTNKYSVDLQRDLTDGIFNNVNGTPTFFINGIKVEGALPLSSFKQIIDSELGPNSTPSPIPVPTTTASPSPTTIPTISDDVYFIKSNTIITISTVGQNPNISISPNDVNVGSTYIVEVKYTLQNTAKTNNYPNIYVPVQLVINNLAVGEGTAYLPLIASHRDGASYTISGVFTSNSTTTQIKLTFDPEAKFSETNKTNNSISFTYSAHGEPNSCNGTCGSSYNCKEGLFCYNGFCRNPQCPSTGSCGCVIAPTMTTTPLPTSSSQPVSTPQAKPSTTPDPDYLTSANNFTRLPGKVSGIQKTTETTPTSKPVNYLKIGVTILVAGVIIYGISLILRFMF
jgi:protein-disulfide isomerase